jgi:hypothetical protein
MWRQLHSSKNVNEMEGIAGKVVISSDAENNF